MTILVAPRQRFPLLITVLGLALLSVFFLYPLSRIFGASFVDPKGAHFTLANYAKILGSAFYQQSVANSLGIGALATLFTVLLAVPLAFALARLPIAGKSALLTLVVLPLVLPSFVSAYALLLMLGRAGFATQALRDLGIPFGSIYGAPGIVAVYALTLYPYVLLPTLAGLKAIDVSVEEASRQSRRLPLARLLDRDLADRHPLGALGRAPRLHRDAGEFWRADRARRGQAHPLRRSLQAFRRRDRSEPFIGGRARRAAHRLDGARASRPAPLSRPPPLRHRRKAKPSAHRDRALASGARERRMLGRGPLVAFAVLRGRRAFLHEVSRPRASGRLQPR